MPKREFNPFYALVVLAGVAFVVTSCAYGVMTVQQLHRSRNQWPGAERPFAEDSASLVAAGADAEAFAALIDRYGAGLMLLEVAALALFTCIAIAWDHHRSWRNNRHERHASQRS